MHTSTKDGISVPFWLLLSPSVLLTWNTESWYMRGQESGKASWSAISVHTSQGAFDFRPLGSIWPLPSGQSLSLSLPITSLAWMLRSSSFPGIFCCFSICWSFWSSIHGPSSMLWKWNILGSRRKKKQMSAEFVLHSCASRFLQLQICKT